MYIFSNNLKTKLLKLYHDDSQIEHFEFEKTLNFIQRKYH